MIKSAGPEKRGAGVVSGCVYIIAAVYPPRFGFHTPLAY